MRSHTGPSAHAKPSASFSITVSFGSSASRRGSSLTMVGGPSAGWAEGVMTKAASTSAGIRTVARRRAWLTVGISRSWPCDRQDQADPAPQRAKHTAENLEPLHPEVTSRSTFGQARVSKSPEEIALMAASSLVSTEAAAATAAAAATKRYLALDAYRGFIMLLLASEGFGFSELRNDPTWGRVAGWFNHVPWDGLVFWDLIQPAFMFMVGVAMPFALAARRAHGATEGDNFRHVVVRSIRLTILSQILICVGSGRIKLQMIIVLSQIAFTYFLSYLIMQWKWRWQVVTAVGLLAFWMALLFAFPGPDGPYSKTDHVGLVVDRWIFHYDYDPRIRR